MRACYLMEKKKIVVKVAEPVLPEENYVQVNIKRAGICGSDLHYFHHGANGAFKVREPYILGHEVCGYVTAIGKNVTNCKVGDQVAVDPNIACHTCSYCREGHSSQCKTGRFMGSASVLPHVSGGFADYINVHYSQCYATIKHLSDDKLVFAEPLSIILHAFNNTQASFLNARVLITGAGPIGCLALMVCKLRGAAEVVMTDVNDAALYRAKQAGADSIINIVDDPDAIKAYYVNKGYFDVSIEASGNIHATTNCIFATKPYGTLLQIGMMADDVNGIPITTLASKEISFVGSFRTGPEFSKAVQLLESGQLDPSALISHCFKVEAIEEALYAALDKSQACKVLIDFEK